MRNPIAIGFLKFFRHAEASFRRHSPPPSPPPLSSRPHFLLLFGVLTVQRHVFRVPVALSESDETKKVEVRDR